MFGFEATIQGAEDCTDADDMMFGMLDFFEEFFNTDHTRFGLFCKTVPKELKKSDLALATSSFTRDLSS